MSKRSEKHLPDRRYTDAEVRLLLEEASRVRGHSSTPPARQQQGLTLAELEEVAAEAQIDVARLRAAAHDLDVRKSARPVGPAARLAGAPLHIHVQRVLPFEVDDEALQILVGRIDSLMGDAGEPRFAGRIFTWSVSANSGRRLSVRVSAHRGTTSIDIEERYSEFAGGLFGGVLGGVGGGVGLGAGGAVASALGSVALAVAIPAVVIGGSYAACRLGFSAYVRRRARRLNANCDSIALYLTDVHEEDSAKSTDTDAS